MEQTKVVSQVFRAVTVTSMESSTTLATTLAGGVLRRTIQMLPGTATWISAVAFWAGTAAIRGEGFLFVASGIEFLRKVSAEPNVFEGCRTQQES